LKNSDFNAYVLASARNLALAEQRDSNILTLCNCCYGSLKHAAHVLEGDATLREEINALLKKEGLRVGGNRRVRHFLEILHDDIGLESLQRSFKRTFKGLKVAVHEGCHLLRPSSILKFDDALSPVKFDALVKATGAEPVPWSAKLDCCGSPLMGVNDALSMDLTQKKLLSAKRAGADCLCVVCPFCHIQFDTVQERMIADRGSDVHMPSILFPQLLGLCLGLDVKTLGIDMNRLPPAIERFLH